MRRGIKKGFSLFVVMIMLMSIFSTGVIALETNLQVKNDTATDGIQILEYQGFQYQQETDGLTIISYNGDLGETQILEIPETIYGIAIAQIAKEAFKDNLNIKQVIIPKTVTSIDKTAFEGCNSLEKITVNTDNDTYYDENGQLCLKKSQELLVVPENWKAEIGETTQKQTMTVQNNNEVTGTNTINTMESIPVLSDTEDIDKQVVVIYKNTNEMNVSSLSLDTSEVIAGESVSDRVDVFELKDNVNIEEVINQLSQNPNVLAVDKNWKIEVSALPNDPYVTNGSEWQFANIGADKTWDSISNATPIVVAVLDTGLISNHPDLQGRTVSGHDYFTNGECVTDLMGHGTMVSGCIAAVANNGIGVTGIAGSSNIKIAPYRVGGANASDSSLNGSYICAALMAAADRSDVKVINMSFGGYFNDSTQAAAIKYAKDKGKILVAAAGNEGDTTNPQRGQLSYPSSFDGVISVAATTNANTRASFSQYNSMVDISAPGYYVATTTNTGGYGSVSGTSFASPITAAACAVLLAEDPSLNATEVESILETTATDLGTAGRDNNYGYGLVQLDKALDYIWNPLEISSFSATPGSQQYVNTAIALKAECAHGKGPYQYQFSTTFNNVKTVLKAYSTVNTATFTPTQTGTFTLTVDAKDASGTIVSQNIENYSVVANPTVGSFTTDKASSQTNGESITLTAAGSNGMAPYTYKFYTKLGTVTTILKDYSAQDTATFIPTKVGSYTLYVDVKDAGGKIATKTITGYTIVNPVSAKTLITDKISGQCVGTPIKLTATGSDGTAPYEYEFFYTSGGVTKSIQTYSINSFATFTPTETGSYTLGVTIKDKNGKTSVKTIADYIIVAKPEVVSFTASPGTIQYINTGVLLTATGTGGKAPCLYQFSTVLNGVKTVIKAYGTASTATFTPTKAGVYTLMVEMKDVNGNVSSKSSDPYTIVANPMVASLTVDKTSSQTIGETMMLTAAGSNGIAPYTYKFYTKLGLVTTTLKDYSAVNTASFTPTSAGSYALYVDVKDAGGKIATKIITGFTIVNPVGVKTLTTDKTSGQVVGTPIKLTAAGSNGTVPYEYQFYYTSGGTTKLLQAYSTFNTATFTPTEINNYTLGVSIRDKNGKISEKTIADYAILAKPEVTSFSVNTTTPQYINTAIQLTATGTGGKSPCVYQFSTMVNGVKTVIKAYSIANTIAFTPTKAGIYTMMVEMKDANGNVCSKLSDPYIAYINPTVTSLTTDQLSGQYINTPIKLTAVGQGGVEPYSYQFTYKLGTATEVALVNDSVNSATFTPIATGSYTLNVKITDSGGKTAIKSISAYTVVAPLTATSFTTSKPTDQAINASIALAATVSGGKSPYQYQFTSQKDGGTETIIRDYTTTASATFKPDAAGIYVLKVNIKDSAGHAVTKTIESYRILPDPVVATFTTDPVDTQVVNTNILLTASGELGKTPYLYQFYYYQGTTKVIIRAFGTANTATFKPTVPGFYDLCVDIKDANGKIATKKITGYSIYSNPTI